MNKIFLSSLLVIAITSAASASELDELIDYGLRHSASGASIRAAYEGEQLTRRAGYYSLIPSLYFSADYDYYNPRRAIPRYSIR
jgi:outer membrane protein TolC